MPDQPPRGPYCAYCLGAAAVLIEATSFAAHACRGCAPRARREAARHGPLQETPLQTPQETVLF